MQEEKEDELSIEKFTPPSQIIEDNCVSFTVHSQTHAHAHAHAHTHKYK